MTSSLSDKTLNNMTYKQIYNTPSNFSDMIMISDGKYLTGLYFINSTTLTKFDLQTLEEKNLPIFEQTKKWLDIYFTGKDPEFRPELKIEKSTQFRDCVVSLISSIAYGKTKTYGDLANIIATNKHIEKMSCQAVGNAVGWNPICIIIPCHRVVGKNGNLTGYSGGMENKIQLLKLEHNDMTKFFIQRKQNLWIDANGVI